MIVLLIETIAIGLLTGAGVDTLLRGRGPRSAAVVVAGVAAAVGGLLVRRSFDHTDVLIQLLAALFGAMLLALIVRVRVSAASTTG